MPGASHGCNRWRKYRKPSTPTKADVNRRAVLPPASCMWRIDYQRMFAERGSATVKSVNASHRCHDNPSRELRTTCCHPESLRCCPPTGLESVPGRMKDLLVQESRPNQYAHAHSSFVAAAVYNRQPKFGHSRTPEPWKWIGREYAERFCARSDRPDTVFSLTERKGNP